MNQLNLKKLALYGNIEKNISFKTLTTFRIGGTAKYVIYPKNAFALNSIISICNNDNIEYKVFGNGSNILCSDDDYEGLVIKLNRTLNDFYFEGNILTAQAGCSLIALAYKALEKNLSGLEFASGIPGTLGGAIFMNAGAYKSDIGTIITEVEVLIDGKYVWLSKEECQFAYRKSIFQLHPDWIISSCKIELKEEQHDAIEELMKTRQAKRLQTQPLNYPSAGSTFRNIDSNFAWQYIDGIGFRGKKVGGAQVSEKHSNFIINSDNAKGNDVIELTDEIKKAVKDKYGVDLILEVEKFNWKK